MHQIYKSFAAAGAVTEPETTVRARKTGASTPASSRGSPHPLYLDPEILHRGRRGLSGAFDASDIIVITDEAHRSQYDILAQNMRSALPNAAFIGFTGTPLIEGEAQKTRDLDGDDVNIYNFRQSIAHHATAPLFYENRIPRWSDQFRDEERDRGIARRG